MLSTNENRHSRIVADLPRYQGLGLKQRLTDRGDLMKSVPVIVVQTMNDAAERIRYLEYHLTLRDG